MESSLELRINGEVAFSSNGKWLHPLFELEDFARSHDADLSAGELRDKVVGRGSAFLIIRLGIRRVHAVLMSRLGKQVLEQAGVALTWDALVDRIECATEGLLEGVIDVETAYRMLSERARAAAARKAPGGL